MTRVVRLRCGNLGLQHVECFHIAKCKYRMLQEHGADKAATEPVTKCGRFNGKCNYCTDRIRRSLSLEQKRSLTPPARGGRNKCLSPLDLVPVPERNGVSVPHRGTNGVSVPRRVRKAIEEMVGEIEDEGDEDEFMEKPENEKEKESGKNEDQNFARIDHNRKKDPSALWPGDFCWGENDGATDGPVYRE